MASNEVNAENSNMSGSEDINTDTNPTLNFLVLLVRIEHVNGRPIELEILTEAAFKELCTYTNPAHKPHAVEILSPHKLCLIYEQGVVLGCAAGELMAIESWMDLPILIMVVIMDRSKVDAIVKARQDYRQSQKQKEKAEIDILKWGQHDLQEELSQVSTQKERLAQQLSDNGEKQVDLLKVVEQLTEKVTKLETQLLHAQGFMTSSSQNLPNPFGNLLTSFQVKADLDIGKFSHTELTLSDELTFDQWCIDVKSYQASYADNILLPVIRKSIVGRAKSVIRHLGPSYRVEEVIATLTQEYEGVASSDVIFKDFYQLKQEQSEKVQVFSIHLRDMLTQLSIRFPDRVPKGDHNKILKDHFFYGIRSDIHNSICHLYDDETVTFSQLLVKVHQNEEEDNTSKLLNKSAVAESTLEHRVDKLIERSNGQFNTDLTRVPQDDNHSYGRPPFQQNQRSRVIFGQTPIPQYMIFGKI